MQIPFRQGIVYAPPGFLQLGGGTVSLQVAIPDMVIVTVADGTSNYLINERVPVANAWAGPFVAGPQSYWLYWDINPVTGARTFGHTLLEPVEGATPPSTPQNDQHWFDTNVNKMKVWNTLSMRWIPKIRVFAAKLEAGAVLISMSVDSPLFTGTQVGSLGSTPINAGPIIYDEDGQAVKRNTGAFFTTEDVAVVGVASGSQVKLGSVVVSAVAESNIPAFNIVRFTGFNRVSLATNFNMTETNVYGMVEVDAVPGDVVNVAMEGLITNPLWNWTSVGVNTPVYVNGIGQLTTTPPPVPLIIGTVVDVHTILLRPTMLSLNATPPTDPQIFTYTATQAMLSTHARNIVHFDSATAVDYQVPTNATLPLPVGTTIVIGQIGAGQVTLAPAVGVTIRTPETLTTRKQFGKVTLIKVATNTWDVEGNLEPV